MKITGYTIINFILLLTLIPSFIWLEYKAYFIFNKDGFGKTLYITGNVGIFSLLLSILDDKYKIFTKLDKLLKKRIL